MLFSLGQGTTANANENARPRKSAQKEHRGSSNRQLTNNFETFPGRVAHWAALVFFLGL
jgi:hypothetical protein